MAGFILHTLPIIGARSSQEERLGGSVKSHTPSQWKKPNPSQTQQSTSLPSLSRLIREVNNVVLSWRDGLTELEREECRRIEERKQILAARVHDAKSIQDWETAARELDRLEGNDKWKLDSSTGDYNPGLIEEKLRELDEARAHGDIRSMMYLIRTSLSRDLGGMGNADLYRHSYIGTKSLIERYVDSAIKTVEALVEKSSHALSLDIEHKDLLEGMLYARQSFGRSALLLSGGATFGMSHIGVLKAMFEANLLPRIISGASAGSIVCAVLCTRRDSEMPAVLEAFPHGDLAVFEGESDSIADHIRRLLTEGSWADISNLTRVMKGLLGDMTFQEAYNRTRRICNICVSTASIYELPRLLNYVTAPNVMIWSAVAASCSVPLVFNAAPLLVKDPATGAHIPWNPTAQMWIDGSVDNDLPMTRLAEMFNVNHFIVSQVNPHVVPFLSKDDRLYPSRDLSCLPKQTKAGAEDNSEWLYTLTTLAKDEALHRLHFLTELGIFPNLFTKLRSILSQRYSGDITILPEIALQDLPRILKNPTAEFMLRNCLIGEKATWPKLSRIRDRCAIELALDRAVHALRARVVFSKSQVDLRRLATGLDQIAHVKGMNVEAKVPAGATATLHPPSSHDTVSGGRHRRNSGSNIQLMARHKRIMQNLEHALTDDDSEEEERLGLSQWRGGHGLHSNGRANTCKPRLKRSAKSQAFISSRGALTSPLQPIEGSPFSFEENENNSGSSFDFSKPLTPPRAGLARGVSTADDSGIVLDEAATESDPGHITKLSSPSLPSFVPHYTDPGDRGSIDTGASGTSAGDEDTLYLQSPPVLDELSGFHGDDRASAKDPRANIEYLRSDASDSELYRKPLLATYGASPTRARRDSTRQNKNGETRVSLGASRDKEPAAPVPTVPDTSAIEASESTGLWD